MQVLDTDPVWLKIAANDIGLKEIPGPRTEPRILLMWRTVKAWFSDDQTPWCGAATGFWMTKASIAPPLSCWRARSWLDWGKPISTPVRGCVVVLERQGGAHVGLVVGRRSDDVICVLGGNTSDSVSVASFSTARVLGYRLPPGGEHLCGRLPKLDDVGSIIEG